MRHVDLGTAQSAGQTTVGDNDSEDWFLVPECPGHGAHDREQGRGDPHVLRDIYRDYECVFCCEELSETLLYYYNCSEL